MASLGYEVAPPTLGREDGLASRRPRLTARSRAIVKLTLAFWLSNFVLLTLGTALAGNPYLPGITAMRALAMLFGLALCGLIHFVLTRPTMTTWRRRIIALALMAPVCAEIFAWVNFFAEMAADPSLNLSGFTWAGAVRTVSFWTCFFLAWAEGRRMRK